MLRTDCLVSVSSPGPLLVSGMGGRGKTRLRRSGLKSSFGSKPNQTFLRTRYSNV